MFVLLLMCTVVVRLGVVLAASSYHHDDINMDSSGSVHVGFKFDFAFAEHDSDDDSFDHWHLLKYRRGDPGPDRDRDRDRDSDMPQLEGSRDVHFGHANVKPQYQISPMTQFSSLSTQSDEVTQSQFASSLPSIFPTSEWLALQAFFNATGGPQWRWYGTGAAWDFGSPLSTTQNPCYARWEGVLCSCNLTKPVTIYKQFYPYYGYYDDHTSPAIERANASCSVVKLFLNRHNLRGTIPRLIGDLDNLTHLHVRSNALSGSFPSGLLSLRKLQVLLMGNNRLIGALPANITCWQTAMRVLALDHNSFTSTLPESWAGLIHLSVLSLTSNSLLGTLPQVWSSICRLKILYLASNSLQGTLPRSWNVLSSLQIVFLTSNRLQGTLPQSWSVLSRLQILDLFSNSLRGSLPRSWSSLNTLQELSLTSNYLTGTLPESWSALSGLKQLYLFSNSLTGTLPQSWSSLVKLEQLFLSDNSLSGTVPHHWSALNHLQSLYLNANNLQGPIPNGIGNLTSLEVLLLDNNYFTGVIPPSLFTLPKLAQFTCSLNCLAIETFIVSNMCAARSLVVLVMDGIHSASKCGNRQLFVSDPVLDLGGTYSLVSHGASEDIAMPLCLLSLPRLTTLHVSGAGLEGNISTIAVDQLSPSLTDLVLSHNYLYGSIPPAIQHRTSWIRLDLSFNLLGGTLAPDIAFNASVTTKLGVSNNRLSGAIPRGLLYQPNISILQGNRFSCDLFNMSAKLPIHDPYESQYRCNGNDFDISVLVWGCVLVLFASIACLVAMGFGDNIRVTLVANWVQFIKSLNCTMLGNNINTTCNQISDVGLIEPLLSSIRFFTVKLTIAIFFLIIIYGLFKLPAFNFTEVTVQGAYLISATQLEGYTPAILLALLYLLVELGGYALIRTSLVHNISGELTSDVAMTNCSYVTKCHLNDIKLDKVCRYGAIIAANTSVAIIANGAYVAAYAVYPSSTVRLISFVLSVFKVLWTRHGVPYLLSYVRSNGNHTRSSSSSRQANTRSQEALASSRLFVCLVVVNTVIVPLLSIILVAPQCARYAFVSPPVISSSISFCLIYITFSDSNGAVESTSCFQYLTISNAYTPPFLYSNQCSFALLSGYADVFTYTFILSGFVVPGLLYLLSLWAHWLSKSKMSDSWLFSLIADVLPRRLLPIEHIQAARSSRTLRKLMNFPPLLMIYNKGKPDCSIKQASCDITMVGVEFVSLELPSADNSIAPMHNGSFNENNSASSNIVERNRSPNVISPSATHSDNLTTPALTIFNGNAAIAQVNQVLSICLSFGVVFPPLYLLGALSLILQSLFVQHSVRSFAASLPESVPSELSLSRCETRGNSITEVDGISVSEIRKTLDAECRHFSSALWHCLPIPFVASFPVLAFFLWEIVSVSYPNAVGYTIILPVLFLVLAFVCWQLLFRVGLIGRLIIVSTSMGHCYRWGQRY